MQSYQQHRYLGDPKYMTEEELDRYINERLGQHRASSLISCSIVNLSKQCHSLVIIVRLDID